MVDRISRAQITAAVKALGFDPQHVAALEIEGRTIRVTEYARDDTGARIQNYGGTWHLHTRTIIAT